MSRSSSRTLRLTVAAVVVVGVPVLVYFLLGLPELALPSQWDDAAAGIADGSLPAGYIVDIIAGVFLLAWIGGVALLASILVRRDPAASTDGAEMAAMAGYAPGMADASDAAHAMTTEADFAPAMTADTPEPMPDGSPTFGLGAAPGAESDEPWYRQGPPIFDEPFRDDYPRVVVSPDEQPVEAPGVSVWPAGDVTADAGEMPPMDPAPDDGIADAEIVGEPAAASSDDPPMIVPVRAYYFTRTEDTLRSISAQFLQTPTRWEQLRGLNAASPGVASMGPDSPLPVGTALALPGDPLPWGKPDPVYLWTLAEKFLFTAWGREPTPEEVVPFWRGLTGGHHLGSGMPSTPPQHLPAPPAEFGAAATGLPHDQTVPAGMPADGSHESATPAPPAMDPSTPHTDAQPPTPQHAPPPPTHEPAPDYYAQPPTHEPAPGHEPPLPPAHEPAPAFDHQPPTPATAADDYGSPVPPTHEPAPDYYPTPPSHEPDTTYEAPAPPTHDYDSPVPPTHEPAPDYYPQPPTHETAPDYYPQPPTHEPDPAFDAQPPTPATAFHDYDSPVPPTHEPAPDYYPTPPSHETAPGHEAPTPPTHEPDPAYGSPVPPTHEPAPDYYPQPPTHETAPGFDPQPPTPATASDAYGSPVPPTHEPAPYEPAPDYYPQPPTHETAPGHEYPTPPSHEPDPVYGGSPVPPTHEPAPPAARQPGAVDLGPIEPEATNVPEAPDPAAQAPRMPSFLPSLTGADTAAAAPEAQAVASSNRSLAGTTIGDAMMLWQLSRVRRRDGGREGVDPTIDPMTESLKQNARVDSLNLIEAAMQHLRAVTVGQLREKPAVLAVRVGTYGFEVLLNRPVQAPDGWQTASGGYVLELPEGVTADDLSAAGQGPTLCPALVPVGDTVEGPLLLNIEEIGCLIVSGPGSPSVNLLNAIVGTLGSSPLAGDIRIITVGLDTPVGLPGWERVHSTSFDSPQLEELISTAHTGSGASLDILVVGPGNDLLIQRAGQVATTPGSRLALIGATSSVAARWPWRIHVDATTTAVVHPIACTMASAQAVAPAMSQLLSEAPEPPLLAPPRF